MRRRLSERESAYILVWAGTERLELWCDGAAFWIPGRDEIASTVPGSCYRHPAALTRSASPRPIPGTILVKDEFGIVEGERQKLFDSYEFVKFIEQTRIDLVGDPKAGIEGRGLSIVEMPEHVEEAMREGIPLFAKSLDRRAQSILQQELERRSGFERKGIPAPIAPNESEVEWAQNHLVNREQKQSTLSNDDLRKALAGAPAPPTVVRVAAGDKGVKVTPKALMDEATGLSLKLKPSHLAGLISEDPKVIAEVQDLIKERYAELKSAGEAPPPAA